MGKTIEEHIEQLKQIPIHDGVSVEYLTCIYETIDAAIEIMKKYQRIEEIVKAWNDMGSFDSMLQISEVIDNGNDNTVKVKLLNSLAKESPMVISTAYAYAKNYVEYGEDITKAWTTATQQVSVIQEVKEKTWVEVYDYFKNEYENYLKADMATMLTEIQLEIEELYPKARKTYRDGLTSYCEGVDDSREIIQQKITELKECEDGTNEKTSD